MNGIRIKQVTDGVQKYVTDTFSGEIKVAKDLTSFSVDFGNVSPDENYIVEYRVSVNKIRESYENTATFSSDEVSHTDIVMAESYIVDHQAKLLTKKVSQERITTETKELGYNLALFAKEGPISVGSIIEDQLADTVRYGRMQDSDYFEAHYDEANNRVSFEVVKEIPFGSTEFIDFTVTPVGTLNDQETIENTASISFLDSDYYSNTVRTVVDGTGSAIVTKVDMDDETNILSGAVFKLLDGEGTLIKENLTTDRAGKIVLSELAIGAYTLVETSAPDNYILDISPINFEIRSENIMVPLEIVVENKREAAGGIEHDELPEQEDPILELPVNEDPSMPIVNKPDKDPEILEEFLDSDGPGKDSLKPGVIRGIVPEKKSRGMERSRYCYSTI
ncbi:collagen adhesion protein [Listeria grandensis FSL F6-0971]|uniref:Collagen adhesion protein n=1 Tax=Listeria grandensis FSL F6-0971 TaxID=1265819 RepID=W7B6Q8_9LIST|nr:SpaA isopeptide-forming pilin-related protein [Listeria grandensis]EUJ18536.1 collagen adhesion protein [Listeria grandensis FSL F6-0971]